jgi:hypothetical protein
MRQRDALKRWWSGIGVLILLVLTACLFCLQHDCLDHDAGPVGLCSAMITMSVADLAIAMLLPLGLTPIPGRDGVATVPLAVPKPPPRRIRFS